MKKSFLTLLISLVLSLLGFALFDGPSAAAQSKTTTPSPRARISTTATPAVTPASPAATPPALQDDDEPIKIDTELVNLNVRVVDRNNRSVNNLQQNDFKIVEDGNVQKIDFFSKSEVPTNYALVIDNSGSLRQQLDKVIEAGKVLINTNRPDDESMVIRFIGRDKIEIVQEFTSHKDDLEYALDQMLIEGGQTAVIDAVYLAVQNVEQYEASKKPEDRKRRAIILVSDGEDRNSYYNEKQLFDLLRESEVQIYVVGFVDDLSKDGGFIGKSPQGKAKALLDRLASETGGKAYYPSSANDLPALAKDISNELRTQYSIGYIPSNDRRDGTYRSIRVTVADGPNKEKRIAISRAGRTAEGSGPGQSKSAPPILSKTPN
jgi:Ca-activated chloride channel family protein